MAPGQRLARQGQAAQAVRAETAEMVLILAAQVAPAELAEFHRITERQASGLVIAAVCFSLTVAALGRIPAVLELARRLAVSEREIH